ncbi:hypothetical protein NC653_035992 [Populus alba x Populus x berolinensis]|uniref:Uncharacterized protein n=1 Tax=Populus alba x Populus x berolinensis TaxID=444605 RepID=A0AAD6PU66_9ROSI|nr:hypothetical protein NC653_035992 [Populus alba x Populus x berolinensis]
MMSAHLYANITWYPKSTFKVISSLPDMEEMKEREGTMWREAKGRGPYKLGTQKSLISNQSSLFA